MIKALFPWSVVVPQPSSVSYNIHNDSYYNTEYILQQFKRREGGSNFNEAYMAPVDSTEYRDLDKKVLERKQKP